MRPKAAEKVIEPANGSLAFGCHLDVVCPWPLCDMPSANRSVCRVPLQDADSLAFWYFIGISWRWLLHPLASLGRVSLG